MLHCKVKFMYKNIRLYASTIPVHKKLIYSLNLKQMSCFMSMINSFKQSKSKSQGLQDGLDSWYLNIVSS